MVFVNGGYYNQKKIIGVGSKKAFSADLFAGKYQVTRTEWEEFLYDTGKTEFFETLIIQMHYYNIMSYPDSAAAGITFFEACEYCNWRSLKDGYEPVYEIAGTMEIKNYYRNVKMPDIKINAEANGYRLPTKDEWFYLVLGGEEGIKNTWWKDFTYKEYAQVDVNFSSTEPVGQLKANPLGLYDILGNVGEWLWYESNRYSYRDTVNKGRNSAGLCIINSESKLKGFLPDLKMQFEYEPRTPLGRGYTGIRMVRTASVPYKEKNVKVNDTNVRLRKEPNLECGTIVLLNSNTAVNVIAKSTYRQEIDGESWYWYKVDADGYPDGWVYGKYLDIEE